MCNFALQLESEVQAGQHAHTQLEEQFEVLSQVGSHLCLLPPLITSLAVSVQEKAYLQSRLEAREAVLMKKHEEMEQLNKQASENVSMHSRYATYASTMCSPLACWLWFGG